MLQCRRCASFKLIALNKQSPKDNDVYRCRECGYLFSPPSDQPVHPPGRSPQAPVHQPEAS